MRVALERFGTAGGGGELTVGVELSWPTLWKPQESHPASSNSAVRAGKIRARIAGCLCGPVRKGG